MINHRQRNDQDQQQQQQQQQANQQAIMDFLAQELPFAACQGLILSQAFPHLPIISFLSMAAATTGHYIASARLKELQQRGHQHGRARRVETEERPEMDQDAAGGERQLQQQDGLNALIENPWMFMG